MEASESESCCRRFAVNARSVDSSFCAAAKFPWALTSAAFASASAWDALLCLRPDVLQLGELRGKI